MYVESFHHFIIKYKIAFTIDIDIDIGVSRSMRGRVPWPPMKTLGVARVCFAPPPPYEGCVPIDRVRFQIRYVFIPFSKLIKFKIVTLILTDLPPPPQRIASYACDKCVANDFYALIHLTAKKSYQNVTIFKWLKQCKLANPYLNS